MVHEKIRKDIAKMAGTGNNPSEKSIVASHKSASGDLSKSLNKTADRIIKNNPLD